MLSGKTRTWGTWNIFSNNTITITCLSSIELKFNMVQLVYNLSNDYWMILTVILKVYYNIKSLKMYFMTKQSLCSFTLNICGLLPKFTAHHRISYCDSEDLKTGRQIAWYRYNTLTHIYTLTRIYTDQYMAQSYYL